ncbi:MAG: hypothetical protein IRY95_00155, partial [Clostridia bacterium]|nr:hypothetical protein [Clostridia bacterium]
MLWSALLRASADVALFAYLPVHLHADLGERRLLVIALAPALAHALRSLGAPLWGTLADGAGRQRPFLAAGLLGYGAALAALSVVGSPRLAVLAVAAAAVPASALN